MRSRPPFVVPASVLTLVLMLGWALLPALHAHGVPHVDTDHMAVAEADHVDVHPETREHDTTAAPSHVHTLDRSRELLTPPMTEDRSPTGANDPPAVMASEVGWVAEPAPDDTPVDRHEVLRV